MRARAILAVLGVIGVLVPAAFAAEDKVLSFSVRGKPVTQLSMEEIRQKVPATRITVWEPHEDKNVTFEGYAPHKVPVIVEVLTDNQNRTAPEIRVLFKKGQLGASGSNKFLFDHVGLVEAHIPKAGTDIEEAAIEAGANEVEPLTHEQNDDIPAEATGARFITDRTQTAAVLHLAGHVFAEPTKRRRNDIRRRPHMQHGRHTGSQRLIDRVPQALWMVDPLVQYLTGVDGGVAIAARDE